MLKNKSALTSLIIVSIYVFLTFICRNHCYIGDNIQQISKEAHWYYLHHFSSLLMPSFESGSDIVATGYHPPLMGILTALLWDVFGYHLWVSHALTLLCGIVLVYVTYRLVELLFQQKMNNWLLLILLLESAVLGQFAVASPDFLLLTAFVSSIYTFLSKKRIGFVVAFMLLCLVNMRGVFAGGVIMISVFVFEFKIQKKSLNVRELLSCFWPFFPTLLILLAYYTYYLLARGWFFNNSAYSDHYAHPNGLLEVAKHMAVFVVRSIENGRFVVWIIALFLTVKFYRSKVKLSTNFSFIAIVFVGLLSIYAIFVFITRMPFSPRYFMPQFFLLTILGAALMNKMWKDSVVKRWMVVVLLAELSGNIWVYPDKISIPWDCSLAHLTYYDLRKETLSYIDSCNIDYHDLGGGFSIYGKRRYLDLTEDDRTINDNKKSPYFIYSNISNLEDDFAVELEDTTKWSVQQQFQKGFMKMIVYKRK